MAVTEFQRNILKMIAGNRIAGGESYVAGSVALNQLIEGSRFSRDIDLFHDTAEAKRSSHYFSEEIDQFSFQGSAPDASVLGKQWHMMLKEAEKIIELLPPEEVGNCILDDKLNLFQGGPEILYDALKRDAVQFHKGSIKGAWPKIRS